jgi:hypothetical protein
MSQTVINPNNSGTIALALAGVDPLVEYQCQIIDLTLQPESTDNETPGTYCADPFDTPASTKWAAMITFLQDWGATPSLSAFTATNNGELCDFEFTPDVDGVPMASGQFYVRASAYGGPASEVWQAQQQRWPMKGAPTFTAPVAVAATAATED